MSVPFTMPADAVRAVIYPQERKITVAKLTGEANRKREALKNAERNAYRLQNSWLDVNRVMMSDEAVDRAMLLNTALLSPGKQHEKPNYNLNLLADQYSNLLAFYTALGSPNIMPMSGHEIIRNPEIASTLINFGLDNPALAALLIAAPTGSGVGSMNAVGNAFKAGMRSSKPIVTRVATSLGKGILAGGRTLVNNAPRVTANIGVLAFPFVAAAADNENSDNENSDGSFITEYPGVAALAGYASLAALRGGYRKWFKEPPGRPVLEKPKLDRNKFKTERAYLKEYDRLMAINQKKFEDATAVFEDDAKVKANAKRREFIVPKTGWGKINRWIMWPSLTGLAGFNIYKLYNNTPTSDDTKEVKTDTLEIVPEYYEQITPTSVDTTSTDTYTIY